MSLGKVVKDIADGGWMILAPVMITILILLSIMTPVVLGYTSVINMDFDYTYPEDYNATLSSLASVEDIDNDGDYELVLYHIDSSSTGAAIEIPVSASLYNTSISFTAQFAYPDGLYVYIIDSSMISAINDTPDREWEDSFDANIDVYGYLIGFDIYDNNIKIMYRNETTHAELTRVSYSFEHGVPVSVVIEISNAVLTVRINGEVVLARSLLDLGINFNYIVIGGRVGSWSAENDCWIDDIVIFTADEEKSNQTSTPPSFVIETYPSEVTGKPGEHTAFNVGVRNLGGIGDCELRIYDHEGNLVVNMVGTVNENSTITFGVGFDLPSEPGEYVWTIEVYNLYTEEIDDAVGFTVIVTNETTNTTTTTTTPTNTTSANTTTTTAITEKLSEWKNKISEWWGGLTTEQKIAVVAGGFIFLMILVYAVSNPSRKVR